MSCWLPWWFSTSVPRPPNLACFSALTPPQHSAYSWSLCTPLPVHICLGQRVQGTATRPALPPRMSPGPNSNHFLKIDGKRLTQTCFLQPTCEMWNLCRIHTTPSSRHSSDFSYTSASQHLNSVRCQKYYIFGLLGLLANKWIPIKSVKVKGLLYVEGRHLYKLKGTEIIYIKN